MIDGPRSHCRTASLILVLVRWVMVGQKAPTGTQVMRLDLRQSELLLRLSGTLTVTQ